MDCIFREMTEQDRGAVLEMMRVFYASPAVRNTGSDAVYQRDIDHCVGPDPCLTGYIFQRERDILGYAMVARSFSTEFGLPCLWLEDLYVRQGWRGGGIGSCFLQYLSDTYPDRLVRLEVEVENLGARRVYEKQGFASLPYVELYKRGAAAAD